MMCMFYLTKNFFWIIYVFILLSKICLHKLFFKNRTLKVTISQLKSNIMETQFTCFDVGLFVYTYSYAKCT